MKTTSLLSFVLLLLAGVLLIPEAYAQQEKLPQDPVARQQVLQALQTIRSTLPQMPALAQQRDAAKFNDDDSTDTGGITGRIEGIPLPTDADSSAMPWVLAVAAHLHEDPTAWAFGEVDTDGDFIINGLSTGTYLVMAGADNYFPQFFSRAYHIWEAIPIEVAPHEVTAGIDFYLEPLAIGEGGITGTITDEETGDPVSRAQIYTFNANNPFIAGWTESNDDGSFELSNLRSGPYYIQVFAEGYFTQYYSGVERLEDATTVQITDGEVTDNVNFAMNRGGSISGTAVNEAGEPIAGASVQAYVPYSRGIDFEYHYGWAATDENGNYTISGLSSGDFVVNLHYYTNYYSVSEWYDNADSEEDATEVPVVIGEETEGINFVLNTPSEFGSISGQITREDGTPVETAIVRIESIDTSNFYFFNFAYPTQNGFYEIAKVPTGNYRVIVEYWSDWFYDVMWYEQANNPEDATPVEVLTDEQTQQIDFVIPVANGVLTGNVTNIEGKPVANAHIQLTNTNRGDDTGIGGYLWAYATTDRDGNYRIEGLPDGEFYLSYFFCYFEECSNQWWPGYEFQDRAEPIVIVDGQANPPSADFVIPIEFGEASISGVVNRKDGTPLNGALVSLAPTTNYPDSTGEVGDIGWVAELQTYTDSLGRYAFDYLREGTFYLYSSYWEEGAWGHGWYEDAQDVYDATPIRLGANEVLENIDFSIDVRSYFGTVAGTVTLEDGTPISRAYVEVNSYYRDYTDIAFYPYEWYGITDENGNFVIDQLYEGEYQLSVYAQGAIHTSMDSSGVEVSHVSVFGGETTTIDLSMMAQNDGPAEIGGTVVSDQGEVPEISIVKAIPVVDNGAAFYTAVTDENGVYRLTGLPEGDYFLQARAPMYLSEYYRETYDPSDAEMVAALENLPAEGIDFSLEPFYYLFDIAVPVGGDARNGVAEQGSSIVYGSVHDEDGEAIAGATVYVVDETGDPILSTETFDDGMYELAGIQPGASYRVKASQIGYESQFNGEFSNLEAAPELTMSNGRYEINFTLKDAGTLVSNDDQPDLPQSLELHGNYPNPFRAATRFQFSIPKSMHVSIAIYDTLGRRIAEVHDGVLSSGSHDIRWDVNSSDSDLSSGLYFYRITTDSETQAGSMTVLR